ncbi:MAG TPA: hypothetical protein VFR50_14985, partial [Casimicrobiaceae bacterium]|nr:hypothetical protein [Casimicrobiaceae bacterium]
GESSVNCTKLQAGPPDFAQRRQSRAGSSICHENFVRQRRRKELEPPRDHWELTALPGVEQAKENEPCNDAIF